MTCPHGFDADHVARALAGAATDEQRAALEAHARACDACSRSAQVLVEARRVWRASIARDEALAQPAREARLASATRVPAKRAPRWRVAILGTAIGALAVLAANAARSPTRATQATASTASSSVGWSSGPERLLSLPTPPAITDKAPAAPPPEPPSASNASNASPTRRIVTARACGRCTRGDAAHARLAAGTSLDGGDGVQVGAGATLVLGWTVDGAADGSRVEITGPASVAATDGPTPAIVVTRGAARAETIDTRELRTAQARIRGDHAAWRIEARADRTRVAALRGTVAIARERGVAGAGADEDVIVLRSGDVVDVLADGRIDRRSPARRASTANDRAADAWRRSEEALARGDRTAAEAALREVVDGDEVGATHDRAALRLAELELARDDREAARLRLGNLLASRDRSVAADAALLLARAATTPSARVAVWDAYLRRSPPSPYAEQAAVERGLALVDVGDLAAARAVADALHARRPLPDVARAALERLDARIAAATR